MKFVTSNYHHRFGAKINAVSACQAHYTRYLKFTDHTAKMGPLFKANELNFGKKNYSEPSGAFWNLLVCQRSFEPVYFLPTFPDIFIAFTFARNTSRCCFLCCFSLDLSVWISNFNQSPQAAKKKKKKQNCFLEQHDTIKIRLVCSTHRSRDRVPIETNGQIYISRLYLER